jgi:cell division control protein 45
LDNDVRAAALSGIYKSLWWFQRPPRASKEQRDEYYALLDKYYMSGTWYGQSAAGIVYILATALERVDNDLLWCAQNYSLYSFAILTNRRLAILGLINQYTRCRISRTEYEKFHSIYYDEVSRLNPFPPTNDIHGLAALSADDMSLRTPDELRFELFRHWTLYDAMSHSSYVSGKMGLWKEQGRKRLAGLLAKMG